MKRTMVSLLCLTALLGPGVARRGHGAEGDRETKARHQAALLAALWPERVAALAAVQAMDPADWAASDRQATWTAALYATAGQGPITRGAQRSVEPAEAVASPTPALDDRLGALDGLLIPPEATGMPEAASGTTCPAMAPGALSWPVRGRVVGGGDRKALAGLVVATDAGEPVRAAAGGRIVFVGVLRGLGRVVIVAHGPHCHTVYAFLARTDVAAGDTVARETILGQAGACPPARGTGVYFELRFREKALNPTEWFAASP
jgi:murein hydrolase activator